MFATGRQQAAVSAAAKSRGLSFEEAKKRKTAGIPAGRMGDPDDVLIGGGLYPGTF